MLKNRFVFVFLYIFGKTQLKIENFSSISFFKVFVEKIDSTVQICNRGAYLANCYLESRPFSNGFQIRRTETGLFPVAQCQSLSVPVDAVWNRLECKSLAFIAVYKSIFVQNFASAMFDYCYQITGTTLNPQWAQAQCSTNY